MTILMSWFLIYYAYAIQPMDPKAMCSERMVEKKEIQLCEVKTKQLKLDWYAATACHAINDNQKFMKCLKNISGGEFNVDALNRCVEKFDDADDSILSCITALKNNRSPASKGAFQTIKVKRNVKK
jgi:hypothetical protein